MGVYSGMVLETSDMKGGLAAAKLGFTFTSEDLSTCMALSFGHRGRGGVFILPTFQRSDHHYLQ